MAITTGPNGSGVIDDGSGADANPTGGPWITDGSGIGYSATQRISSTLAGTNASGASAAYRNDVLTVADCECFATMSKIATVSAEYQGVWARFNPTGNSATSQTYVGDWTNGTGFRCWKRTAGAWTQLGTTDATAPANGWGVAITCVGTSIKTQYNSGASWTASVNASATDSAISAGGRLAFYAYGNNDGELVNFGGGPGLVAAPSTIPISLPRGNVVDRRQPWMLQRNEPPPVPQTQAQYDALGAAPVPPVPLDLLPIFVNPKRPWTLQRGLALPTPQTQAQYDAAGAPVIPLPLDLLPTMVNPRRPWMLMRGGIITAAVASTAIAFDMASSSAYQAALSSYSWNHTCSGNNRGLLVGIAVLATGAVNSITYNSVAMRFVRADVNGVYRQEVWALENPSSGTNSIAVTLSTSLTSVGSAVSYTNVNQTDMVETAAGANGLAGTPSASVTTVDDLSWIVSFISTADATTSATNGAERANNAGALGSGAISDTGPITPVGAQAMGWAAVGITDSWAETVVALDTLAGVSYTWSLAGAITPTGVLTRASAKALAGALTPAGALVKAVAKPLAGALTPAGGLTKAVSKALAGGLTPTGALTLTRQYFKSLAGAITPAGNLTKDISKALAGSLSPAGTIAKAAAKALTGALTPSGVVGLIRTGSQLAISLAGTIVPAGSLAKAISKRLAGGIIPSGLFARLVSAFITLVNAATNLVAPRDAPSATVSVTVTTPNTVRLTDALAASPTSADTSASHVIIRDERA